MKNLKLILNLHYEFPELENPDFVLPLNKPSVARDFISADELVVYVKSNEFTLVSLVDGSKKSYVLTDVKGATGEISPVISVFFNDLSSTFYSFHLGGEIICFTLGKEGITESQLVDTLDGGFIALDWSGDKELGAAVNSKNELFIISPSGDVLNYWDLQDSTKGEQSFVNVGWGKKETQFQGSAGKAAAFAKPELVDSNDLRDDHSVNIAWRGDSSIFAVSYWCLQTSKRKIKIFNRDGVLQCNGEDLNGLEEGVAWRPEGKITMVQRLPNKYVVAFMEKNGLKQYDFTLPSELKVLQLRWSYDSQILCTSCVNTKSGEYKILLWVTSNYHWYLKQTFTLPSKPLALMWDWKREKRLRVALENGILNILEFAWTIDLSSYSSSDENSYVSVIDGDKLLVTQFSAAVVPPPMAMWTLTFNHCVNQVCYPYEKSSPSFAVFTDKEIYFVSKDDNDNLFVSSSISVPLNNESKRGFSWLWISETKFVCLQPLLGSKTDLLWFNLLGNELLMEKKTTINFPVVSFLVSKGELLLGKSNGKFVPYAVETSEMSQEKTYFPELCVDAIQVEQKVIGLCETGRLYVNGLEVASNVTSYAASSPFLIATTSHHTMLVLKVAPGGEMSEITQRKLENGSKLVIVTDTSAILQLPRGNLETIHPRCLVFCRIASLLDGKQYREAVQLLRKNRILLDVCVDHNPTSFLENVDTFVDQVDSQSLLILVSELSSNDVTTTLYSSFYDQNRVGLKDKINQVASTMLNMMQTSTNGCDYQLPILSCLVKMKKIAEAIDLANSEQSLQHLLFLIPVEKLYSYALEAYNLAAALKIAGRSQMDPKEYMPHLNNLRQMDIHYMKFTVDKALKKYSSALNNLVNCGNQHEDEFFAFMKDHNLYKDALSILPRSDGRYKKTALLYGEYLEGKRYFGEAGSIFLRAGCFKQAIHAFSMSCDWQRAVSLAKNQNFCDDEMKKLYSSLKENLIASSSYKDAALFSELYQADYEGAIEICLLGRLWDDALRIATMYNCAHLIDSKIKARISDYADSLSAEINSRLETIDKYTERLKIVRVEKANKPKFQDFVTDDMSETSSISSRSATSHTSKSSKMTRKASRKLWSLKEGNPREEEALLSALKEIILNSQKTPGEVKCICGVLVYLELDSLASKLQLNTKNLLLRIQKLIPTIWPKDPNEEPTAAADAVVKCAPEFAVTSGWLLDCLSIDT